MLPEVNSYQGHACCTFELNGADLSVKIETKHLRLRSVKPNDLERYAKLLRDSKVMEKYGTGNLQKKADVRKRIDSYVKRWSENDPYSGFAVFDKRNRFIGHVVLGHGDVSGVSELAYLFHRRFWHKGFGSEIASAMVKDYAPELIKRNYMLDHKRLTKITATSRQDNLWSCRILEKLGMTVEKQEEKFGHLRNFYTIRMEDPIAAGG